MREFRPPFTPGMSPTTGLDRASDSTRSDERG